MPVRTHACRALAACMILAALALPRTLPAAQASLPSSAPAASQRGEAGFAVCGGLSVTPGPGEPWPGDRAVRPGEVLSPADKGLGCRFVPPGKAGGAPLLLEARLTRPSGTDGAPVVDRWFVPARRGEPAAVTYAFFPPGTAAPGEWRLELFDGDTRVASQTFVMPEGDLDDAPSAVRAAATASSQQDVPVPAPAAAANPDVAAASPSAAGEAEQAEPAPEATPAPVAPPLLPASPSASAPRAAAPEQAATPQAPATAQKASASPAPPAITQKTSTISKAATPPASKAGSPAPAAPKPAAAPAREPAGKGKDAAKGFVALQTGLFADAANAQGQAAKLRGRGIPACLVEEGQGKTKRYRVLAGRYGERRAALAARNEVRSAAGVSPLVFEVAPDVSAGLRCH